MALLRYAWLRRLELWSKQRLWIQGIQEYAVELPDDSIQPGWLGHGGASEEALAETERRLGQLLPPSCREFLRLSNGWRRTTSYIERLLPVAELDTRRGLNQEWVTTWTQELPGVSEAEQLSSRDNPVTFRTEYLGSALQISDVGDAAIYVLDPEVMAPDGEWEAWLFAS